MVRSDECTGYTDEICSSIIAPALLYYRPSIGICNFCIPAIPGGIFHDAMDGVAAMLGI
jgi:hypothetical protein